MKAKFSLFVQKEIVKLQQKDKNLARRLEKQIKLFESNPKHPSLRLHKLTASTENVWSISITMSIRMLYRILDDDIAYFFDIGTHDEVYKK